MGITTISIYFTNKKLFTKLYAKNSTTNTLINLSVDYLHTPRATYISKQDSKTASKAPNEQQTNRVQYRENQIK